MFRITPWKASLAVASSMLMTSATYGQLSQPGSTTAQPSRLPGGLHSSVQNNPAPKDVKLVEKKLEEMPNQDASEDGKKALAMDPLKWKHAMTDNFIIHYRRATEAQKVAREVEYQLWYVASFLGAGKERYTKKSHIYVFEDEKEWESFTASGLGGQWVKSFAHGDDLFLNIRGAGNTGTGSFDFVTLAHETTHAVVSRLYPGKRWPLWLNEGFAEYMAATSVGGRKGGTRRFERSGATTSYTPDALVAVDKYPSDLPHIHALYESSQKLVTFLLNELPRERFLPLLDLLVAGKGLQEAVLEIYSDKIKSWPEFNKRYEHFAK